jgi:GH25 family lysozyme M1 (1,4-beta-N-acetylmuramidase)
MGLGWQMFSSGVINGFEKAIDIGAPIIKNLTQEARDYVNSPEQLALPDAYDSTKTKIPITFTN